MTTTNDSPTLPEQACTCDGSGGAASEFSRRSLLRRAAAGAGLAALAGPTVSTRLAWAQSPTYTGDTLVVLSLRGGFDGLTAVPPVGDPDYAPARPDIAVPAGAALQLDATFGLHPALAPLMPLWASGQFAVVHAVGQAAATRSHFAAMQELERAAPGTRLRTGWLDRTLGLRGPGSAFQAAQVGSLQVSPALLGPSPELAMDSVDSFALSGADDDRSRTAMSTALRGLHSGAPTSLKAPAAAALAAVAQMAALKSAGYQPEAGATYPESELGKALRDVARLVRAQVGLQVACIDIGDWDMHANLGGHDRGWMYDKLTDLGASLAAFATDLGAAMSGVTVVTLSEFGRRVVQNGSGGLDHGHGNAVLLLGGGVVGGKVHGSWPSLAPAARVAGDLAGTTDYRLVLGEILQARCGAGDLSSVFPGLKGSPLGVVRPR